MVAVVNKLMLRSKALPEALRHVDPPVRQLFVAGAEPASWLDKPKLAVVGSRKNTPYGRLVTQQLVSELVEAGVVIISGLALGIDSIAHRAALDAGGLTVAVLPTGLDKIYPAAHQNLAKQIIAGGGSLISEYPSSDNIHKVNFIARNRIVSALADALLITEAAVKSGSLHTARFALNQGKSVLAVPGNINNSTSEGCNNLIKSGAVPVTDASDIFFALNIKPSESKPISSYRGSDNEKLILKLVAGGMNDQDDLAMAAKINGQELASILTVLEIAGRIRPEGNGRWLIA